MINNLFYLFWLMVDWIFTGKIIINIINKLHHRQLNNGFFLNLFTFM